jgi:hypothetical protein
MEDKMKKFSFVLSLLMVFLLSTGAFAATKASRAVVSSGVEQVVGLGDLSSGDTAEVNSVGGVATTRKAVAVTSQVGDALVYTGACYVQGITFYGVTAGDRLAVYDALSATGTAKFDPAVAANTSTVTVDCFGAPFTTGIYVDASAATINSTVIYDY